jgi:hypothetical protein
MYALSALLFYLLGESLVADAAPPSSGGGGGSGDGSGLDASARLLPRPPSQNERQD